MSRTQRSLGLLSLIVLATSVACVGDEAAPDCFYPDTAGGCVTPPIVELALSCDDLPTGAIDGNYAYTPNATGGTGSCEDGLCAGYEWTVTGLPEGLSLNTETGLISGSPTEEGSFPLTISVRDGQFAGESEASCNLQVNPALNVDTIRNETNHCLAVGQDINDFIAGGDGSTFTCSLRDFNADQPTCPYGDGNGVLPAGITTDYGEGRCSHSGTVAEDAYGTWVWVVEMEQSGNVVHVPFCASQEAPQQHTVTVDYDGGSDAGLEPLLVEFGPNPPDFGGNGDPLFTVDAGSLCTAGGGGCACFGFSFAVTCSPLDPEFSLEPGATAQDAMMNTIGFTHEMSASLPPPTENFRDRVWVANWSVDYCNAPDNNGCGACADDNISTNAQSHVNYSVVGWPAAN